MLSPQAFFEDTSFVNDAVNGLLKAMTFRTADIFHISCIAISHKKHTYKTTTGYSFYESILCFIEKT